MRQKTTIFLLLFMFLLTTVPQVKANELQRLVFNAAGNIGVTEAIVEFQGITPGNSPTINNYINTAITMLNQLISQYNDPPFDSGRIRKIVTMLERFPVATARMNNRGRATYLQNCFTNLKSAMSTIFRSDQGLKDLATCDTFVATLGYNTGKAMAGIMINNRFLENEGRSGINLALSSGTRTRDTLGCSFLTADQIRALDIQNRRTSAEFGAMLRELENDVRVASLNMEPGFDSPATKRTTTTRINPPPPPPPPPPNPPINANDPTGNRRDGQTVLTTKKKGLLVWVKQDNVIINANKDPLEILPTEPRYNGSFLKYTVEETNMTVRVKSVDNGNVDPDVSFTVSFERPPIVLNPGLRYKLGASVKHGGVAAASSPGAQFWYSAQRGFQNIIRPPEVLAYYPWNKNFNGISSKEWMLTAPPVSKEGATFQLYAGLWNSPPCNVTWTYRAEYH